MQIVKEIGVEKKRNQRRGVKGGKVEEVSGRSVREERREGEEREEGEVTVSKNESPAASIPTKKILIWR